MNQIQTYTLPAFIVEPTYKGFAGGLKDDEMHPMAYGTIRLFPDMRCTRWKTHEVLDNMTLAIEQGLVDRENYVNQLFAETSCFSLFLDHLEYLFDYRMHDRWWYALATLIERDADDHTLASAPEMAQALREHAYRTGQLPAAEKR